VPEAGVFEIHTQKLLGTSKPYHFFQYFLSQNFNTTCTWSLLCMQKKQKPSLREMDNSIYEWNVRETSVFKNSRTGWAS